MAQITLIVPQAAEVTGKHVVVTDGYPGVVLSADALADDESAAVYMGVGPAWVAVTDSDGNAQTLTADKPMLALVGGPTYAVTKSSTGADVGVYADFMSRTY